MRWTVSGSSSDASAVEPTTSQNSAVTTLRASTASGSCASGAPHSPQKRNPLGLGAAQRSHVAIAQHEGVTSMVHLDCGSRALRRTPELRHCRYGDSSPRVDVLLALGLMARRGEA